MTSDIFLISSQKQKQFHELWNCINDQKYLSECTSIIQYVINEIPADCGVDFQYLNIKIEDLSTMLTSGYYGSYSDLGKLFSSAVASSIGDLTDEISAGGICRENTAFCKFIEFLVKPRILFKPDKTNIIETIFSFKFPRLMDKCVLSAIKFVVYASIARHLAQFYINDWEITSASFVAVGIGLIVQIPVFSAYMDMVFKCIFESC
jgi:hypothetical protein